MSPSRPDLHQMQSRPCKYRTAAHHIGLRIRERVYTHTHTHTSSYSSDLRTSLSLSLYLCMCVHIRARIMLCVADISSYKAVVTVVYERTNSFNVFVCRFVRGRTEWLRLHGTSNHLINAVRQRRLQVKRMWPATVTNLITSTASHKRRRRRVLTMST